MWILLVEDEARLAQSLRRGLEEEGHIVDCAADGEEGETLALANAYDALIVDWRLPRQDGKTLVERVRAAGRTYPILMLTALGDVDHRVAGLDAGADDYLAKPFSFEELAARLRALRRRPPLEAQEMVLRAGGLEMDTARRRVTRCGRQLFLSPKEYAFLELLMRNTESVISRTVIAERVWGDALYVSDNAIDVTVSNLRQKLAEARADAEPTDQRAVRIETVRGVGYCLALGDQP